MIFPWNDRVERARAEKTRLDAAASPDGKPVRPYRSEAERIAVHQRNIQIGLSLVILALSLAGLLAELGVI